MTHINFDSGLIFHGSLSGGYPPEPEPPGIDNVILTGGSFKSELGATYSAITALKMRGSYTIKQATEIDVDIKSVSAAIEILGYYKIPVDKINTFIGDTSAFGYNNPGTIAVTDFKIRYNLINSNGVKIANTGYIDLTKEA